MLIAAAALLAATAAPLYAIKPDRPRKDGRASAGRVLSRFDRDSNGSLDASEAERVRRLFNMLKALDTDNDGKLSDSEAAAAKIEKRQGRKKSR
jgi:hypothetical protein